MRNEGGCGGGGGGFVIGEPHTHTNIPLSLFLSDFPIRSSYVFQQLTKVCKFVDEIRGWFFMMIIISLVRGRAHPSCASYMCGGRSVGGLCALAK